MLYEDYLKEVKKNNKIRLIGRSSWSVYKSKFGEEKALEFLKNTKSTLIKNPKTGKYKIDEEDILDIQGAIKAGIPKEIIAEKYGVTVRSIYRYNKMKVLLTPKPLGEKVEKK